MSQCPSRNGVAEPLKFSSSGRANSSAADSLNARNHPLRLAHTLCANRLTTNPKTWTSRTAIYLRICGNYRRPNEQLEKSHPTSANGTDELQKLPGYSLYWESDRYAMYNAFILAPGPSRELLALHTPIDLIQRTRMVFGELNAGTVACATTPSDLRLLPRNAHARTASYVDDAAQGSHTFDELLLGWRNFLALCLDRSWTLSAKKTRIGYDHCTFFRFYADKHGTRLADKNLDPVRRMIPPTNLPELRHVNGVFVQSKSYIPNFAHLAKPLNALTKKANDQHVPFTWGPAEQLAYDSIRNHLLDGVHLSPPNYCLPFHCGGDASNDGKAFGLHQFNDLPAGSTFTVTGHTTATTTVTLTDNTEHIIQHNDDTRKNICWFSRCWTEAERKRAPFYLEAHVLLWGLEKVRFWALSSPFPLYVIYRQNYKSNRSLIGRNYLINTQRYFK
jgi:hypothetical protein